MPKYLQQFPLHKQNTNAIGGLDVGLFAYDENLEFSQNLSSHRDDYYILMVTISGSGILQCDMEQIMINANSILLVKPYQVHCATQVSSDSQAYIVSIAPFLMPEHCSQALQNLPIINQGLNISSSEKKELLDTLSLLHRAFNETNSHKTFIIHSLFHALINRATAIYMAAEKKSIPLKNQPQLLTYKFTQLVSDYSFAHTASFYSDKLNITTSHLNDCVKAVTGTSVTHYLQQAMLTEAKKQLYYTNHEVKVIAFSLGYEDHTYFSRLFKKLSGYTPLSFRNKFRE